MDFAEQISAFLPGLRRYARSLTGSQASGDAYVAAFLEALVADQSMFNKDETPKVESFRLLSKMWASLEINQTPTPAGHWEAAASRKLAEMPPRERQAFLLVSVEGFETDEVARVLEISGSEVINLVEQAARDINEIINADVLIIEDEPLIALDIQTLVADLGHNATGIARTHAEAIELAKEKTPGLVLADIQLADGSSGIDAVNELLKSFNVPVVFITAYPERLLTGEKPEPAFLITKPFVPEMVKAIISQALFFEETAGDKQSA